MYRMYHHPSGESACGVTLGWGGEGAWIGGRRGLFRLARARGGNARVPWNTVHLAADVHPQERRRSGEIAPATPHVHIKVHIPS